MTDFQVEFDMQKVEEEYYKKYGREYCQWCANPNEPDEYETTSNCCDATISHHDICDDCKEHCEPVHYCTSCHQDVYPEED